MSRTGNRGRPQLLVKLILNVSSLHGPFASAQQRPWTQERNIYQVAKPLKSLRQGDFYSALDENVAGATCPCLPRGEPGFKLRL